MRRNAQEESAVYITKDCELSLRKGESLRGKTIAGVEGFEDSMLLRFTDGTRLCFSVFWCTRRLCIALYAEEGIDLYAGGKNETRG